MSCKRCGTCCRKGGPGLHRDDCGLVENGALPIKYLFTLREGEPAFDNINNQYAPLTTDLIKIKGQGGGATCVFLDNRHGCSIYMERPLECRALACWNTTAIEMVYNISRLTRADLLSKIIGLWELVRDHHERCNYTEIQELAAVVRSGNNLKNCRKLLEIVKYDISIRELVVEKGYAKTDMLDFLFGRPLIHTVRLFGLSLNTQKDGFETCGTPYDF